MRASLPLMSSTSAAASTPSARTWALPQTPTPYPPPLPPLSVNTRHSSSAAVSVARACSLLSSSPSDYCSHISTAPASAPATATLSAVLVKCAPHHMPKAKAMALPRAGSTTISTAFPLNRMHAWLGVRVHGGPASTSLIPEMSLLPSPHTSPYPRTRIFAPRTVLSNLFLYPRRARLPQCFHSQTPPPLPLPLPFIWNRRHCRALSQLQERACLHRHRHHNGML